MKIGIDLGTANVLVYVKGKGIVISEPSVVAISDDNRIVAVGEEAREMIGRTPGNIQAIRPMKDGVIADYVITEAMLRFFISKATKGRIGFSRPEVMISVPAAIPIPPSSVSHAATRLTIGTGGNNRMTSLTNCWVSVRLAKCSSEIGSSPATAETSSRTRSAHCGRSEAT